MRITGGLHRGRTLTGLVPAGVRPTGSRVREALFSIVGQDLAGWSVLDAFGGTGLLGFEAASRGAGPVLIVERHRGHARNIQRSAADIGLSVRVRQGDAAVVLASGRWDLVLLDPPYAEDPAPWLHRAAPVTTRYLVVEHQRRHVLPEVVGGLSLDRRRDYGDTALSIYRPTESSLAEPSTDEPSTD